MREMSISSTTARSPLSPTIHEKHKRLMFDLKSLTMKISKKHIGSYKDVCEKPLKRTILCGNPSTLGVQEMDSAGYSLRIYATARKPDALGCGTCMKKSLLEAFKAENIRLATNLNVTMFGVEQDADEVETDYGGLRTARSCNEEETTPLRIL
jgi:hypothetical protein